MRTLWLLLVLGCSGPGQQQPAPPHITIVPCRGRAPSDARPAADAEAAPRPHDGGYDFSNDVIDGDLVCPDGADGPTPSECEAAKLRLRERDALLDNSANCAR